VDPWRSAIFATKSYPRWVGVSVGPNERRSTARYQVGDAQMATFVRCMAERADAFYTRKLVVPRGYDPNA
jgi:hypothetical protein